MLKTRETSGRCRI